MLLQTEYNEVVVLQQGGDSSVLFKSDRYKKICEKVNTQVVGAWDGLDECEIFLPEILSQSCPVLHGGCSVMIHSLANKILNVSYFVLMCQYDVRSTYQHDTKTGCGNGYFLLKYMSDPKLLYFNLSKKV